MQIKDLVPKIIEDETVPIHIIDSKTFSCITYLKENSNNERGLYFPNCDSLDALEYCKSTTPYSFERIKTMIRTKCTFNEISFSVFSILHELGHWIQYKNFIDANHNDKEFILLYEIERAFLYSQRKIEYEKCKNNKEDVAHLMEKYEKLYANLPTEQYADCFALSNLEKYVMMIKKDMRTINKK